MYVLLRMFREAGAIRHNLSHVQIRVYGLIQLRFVLKNSYDLVINL